MYSEAMVLPMIVFHHTAGYGLADFRLDCKTSSIITPRGKSLGMRVIWSIFALSDGVLLSFCFASTFPS